MHSSYWRAATLAVLAKLSTKLKILAQDFRNSCHDSLLLYEELREELEGGDAKKKVVLEWQLPQIDDDEAVHSRYSIENAIVSRWVQDCLAHMLVELGARLPLHVPLDAVDVSALVFRAGRRRGAVTGLSGPARQRWRGERSAGAGAGQRRNRACDRGEREGEDNASARASDGLSWQRGQAGRF
ncbi:hypothetical protein VTG60DRAFT_715 [Thermothelomyces hinnuleus]